MILSGETNIWGKKQNQKYTRQHVRPIMTYALETIEQTVVELWRIFFVDCINPGKQRLNEGPKCS